MQGQQQANSRFCDKEMMEDVLTTQKHLTDTYNTFANECASPAIKNEMMAILEDEHKMQHDVFCDMQKKGWYQTEPAQAQKITQTKQKFQGML